MAKCAVIILFALIMMYGFVNAYDEEQEVQNELPVENSPLIQEIQGTFTNDKSEVVVQDSVMQYDGQTCAIQEIDDASIFLPDCGELTVNILREESRLIGLGIADDIYTRKVDGQRFLGLTIKNTAKKIKAVQLDSVIAGMSTGDILMHHGVSLNSMAMEVVMDCYWSHTAIILKDLSNEILQRYNVQNPQKENLFVFETTAQVNTTRIVPFKTWVANEKKRNGDKYMLAYRKLNWDGVRNAKENPELTILLNEAHGRPYETSRVEMLLALIDGNWEENLSSLYCSELVMWTYKALGLVSPNVIASNWPTAKFSNYFRSTDYIAEELRNNGIATIDPEVRLEGF